MTSSLKPEDRREAQRDLETLLELPRDQREPKIRRALKRFRSSILAELLLETSDERRAADADEAHHLADLAQTVLHHIPSSARAKDLQVLCLTHLAAASKALGDLESAERLFRSARMHLESLLAPGLRVQADLDQFEGGYRKDRRQLQRSEKLLERAISLYGLIRDELGVARTRLVLGLTQFHAGAIENALTTTSVALEQLDPEKNLRLFMMGRYNTALYLAEAGRGEDAATRFKSDLPLYRKARSSWPNLDLHFHWLAGKIQRTLDKLQQAEDHLVRARDGFTERGTAYDAILVCLDLGLVLAAERRHEELSELADLMISGLAAQGLHDEAMAAVSLAAEAAREQRLTEDLVRQVSHFLQFSRHDPSLKWRFVRDPGH